MKLNTAKLKTLPLEKSVCDGANLYFTRTGPDRGKWCFRYQRLGRKHEMGLGPYPAISLANARQRARELHILMHQGKDPLQERREAERERKKRESKRFSDIARQYIDEHKSEWHDKKGEKTWHSTLERFVYPLFDQKPFADLTTEDVIEVLSPIWQTKKSTAKKIQGRMKLIFGYAKTARLYEGENPAAWQDHLSHYFAMQTNKHLIKHHRALHYADAPSFFKDLRQIETLTSQALQFTLLTAARTSETIGATSDEFDLEKQLWRVPADRMKAKKPHAVPLSMQASTLIKTVMRSHNAPLIFHGRNPEKPLSNMAMLNLVKKQLKFYDTTVHGLRSTFRTWAGEKTNYSPGVIEFALAHQLDEKIEGAYLRSELVEPRRPLMQDWADFLNGRPRATVVAPAMLN